MTERMRYAGHPGEGPYAIGLDRNEANFAPLTPLTFLERTAAIYPDRLAVIHGGLRRTYRELHQRCRRLGSALEKLGIEPGDTVAAMLPNVPAMLECHYGVPMAGAVLNALNTRSDPSTIAFILKHGGARALIVDSEFAPLVRQALDGMASPPIVIDMCDPEFSGPHERLGELDYEELVASGDPATAPT
jgi:fatty-acyl-CoA synthase